MEPQGDTTSERFRTLWAKMYGFIIIIMKPVVQSEGMINICGKCLGFFDTRQHVATVRTEIGLDGRCQ